MYFENIKYGNIIVEKITDPADHPQTFEFTPSWGSNFFLSDGQTNDSGPIPPTTYTVEEINLPIGWSCMFIDGADSVSEQEATIDLEPGQTRYITFYNAYDNPPVQTIELGFPRIEEVYWTGIKWLPLIGGNTPVWINSSDQESGSHYIMYKVFWGLEYGTWTGGEWIYVYDQDTSTDPRYNDLDRREGFISIRLTFDISCFHEIHAHCYDNEGNVNYSIPEDFMVDADAPSQEWIYEGPILWLDGGAKYISNRTIKRIWVNDSGCTGGKAGVCYVEWRLENYLTQLIAEGYVEDNAGDDIVLYGGEHIIVSGDLNPVVGEIMFEVRVLDDCRHWIIHQAFDCLGNYVDEIKQLVYVDNTPPGINKTLPDHGYYETEELEPGVHTGFLKAGQSIVLEAEDYLSQSPIPCNSGLEALFFRWEWMDGFFPTEGEPSGDWLVVNGSELAETYGWDNPEIIDHWWYRVDEGYAEITWIDECRHDLYYFAKDNVWNYGEVQKQIYLVDEYSPDIVLELPDHGYVPVDDDSGFLKVYEPVYMNATDASCNPECKAGIESIFWRYEYQGFSYPLSEDIMGISGESLAASYGEQYDIPEITNYYWYANDDDIAYHYFLENCTHKLFYFTKDNVCHRSNIYSHTFFVDDSPPYLEFSYPEHGYYLTGEFVNHLKCDTTFTVNAYDLPDNECKAGVESIFWRYEWIDETGAIHYFPSESGVGIVHGEDLYNDYGYEGEQYNHFWYRIDDTTMDISFPEECEHYLYIFTKDNVCQPSEIYEKIFYVDCSEPYVIVSYPDHGFYVEDCCTQYLKADTDIMLTAIDQPDNDCQAGIESIFWRYDWIDETDTSHLFPIEDEMGAINGTELTTLYGYNDPEITNYWWYLINDDIAYVSFPEQCQHEFYYFAKDNLCDRSEIYHETYLVDDTNPEIELNVSGHGFYYDESQEQSFLRVDKHFTLEATDDHPCAAGIETIFFRYDWGDGDGGYYPGDDNIFGYDEIDGEELVNLYGDDYDISQITQYRWFRVNSSVVDVWFAEECKHHIWFFAKDNVCHRTEIQDRIFYVDGSDPATWLSYPEEHGYYEDNEKFFIKCGKEIEINTWDLPENQCAAGIEGIFYRYEFNGQSYPQGEDIDVTGAELAAMYGYTDPEIINYNWSYIDDTFTTVSFNEECEHKLFWFTKDKVCHNSGVFNETYQVDCSGPEIDITYPNHGYYVEDCCTEYLKEDTPITLTAFDKPDNNCKSNIESIFWRYEWTDESETTHIYPSELGPGVITYEQLNLDYGYEGDDYNHLWYRVDDDSVNIEFEHECVHNLYFFAKDNVCNPSIIYTKTFKVDDTNPEIELNVSGHGFYYDESQEQSFLRVDKHFTLEATDDHPCAAGIETIFFRYDWGDGDGGYYPGDDNIFGYDEIDGEELVNLYGDDYDISQITQYRWFRVNSSVVDVWFAEECKHHIWFFAKDNVCHRTEIQDRIFYVDGSDPATWLSYPEEHGYYEDNEKFFIKCGKEIEINTWDLPENQCAAGIEGIFYRYEFNGQSYPQGEDIDVTGAELAAMYGYTDPEIINYNWSYIDDTFTTVSFNEECEHKLFWFTKDKVCHNSGVFNETIYVDCSIPELEISVGEPNCSTECVECDGFCITNETDITISAFDKPENNCSAGIEGIFWRYTYNENVYPDDPEPDMTVNVPYDIMTATDIINAYGYTYDSIIDFDWYYSESMEVVLNFSDECTHVLYYWAKDNLCHHTDVECLNLSVDLTPPKKPIKTINGPHAKLEDDSQGHDQWIVYPGTDICFEAEDDGVHDCGPITIEYRYWYLGEWTDWMILEDDECVNLQEGCIHYLEARAFDCLGNRGEIDNETFWVCGPGGDNGPDITILNPSWGDEPHCEPVLEVIIDAFDSQTDKEDLKVILWIPGGRRDAPTLWYYPEYNATKYGDEYFHAFIDIYKYQNGAELTLEAIAIDEDNNVEQAIPIPFTVCSTVVWDQWMQHGWNKLTLPFGAIPCDDSVESVLASIDGSYDVVFYYDEVADDWDSFVYGDPWNPLDHLETGKQYWIHISGDGLRYYTDTQGPSVVIEYPIDETTFIDEGLSMDIWGDASDIETGVKQVILTIFDNDTGEYWTGSDWGVYTEHICDYDANTDQWICIGTQNIELTIDQSNHKIIVTAIATDMVGCTAEDMVWFMYINTTIPEECNPDHTWTTTSDFNMGNIQSVLTVDDQLTIEPGEGTTYPTLWIANAGEDSLSKFDTNTNKEVARYHTWFGPLGYHDAWAGPAPSRTCVDSDGNCYIANRHFDTQDPDVIKVLTDDWIDRNGNGIMDTSYDEDGSGTIEPDEMLPMTDLNSNGIIDDEEIVDERIAWATHVDGNGYGRGLAIDLDGYIWLGCYGAHTYYKLDPDTGDILGGPYSVGSHTPYGALVDKYGYLWGSSLTSNILKMNTSDPSDFTTYYVPSTYGIALGYDSIGNTLVYCGGNYPFVIFNSSSETYSYADSYDYVNGIAVNSEEQVLVGSSYDGDVAKYTADGSMIWEVAGQIASHVRGIVIDSNDDIWTIHLYDDKICKYNGTNGDPLGIYNVGHYPYTYSDASGTGYSGSVNSGKWTVTYDSLNAGTIWNSLSWNGEEPENTEIIVKIRSSEDQMSWSPWEETTSGDPLSTTPNAQYIQIEITLKTTGEELPIIYDITVDGTCAS